MNNKRKFELLEDLLELEEGILTEDTELNSLEEWDSVAALSLIVLLDEEYNKSISGQEIKKLKVVGDILKLMELENFRYKL